MYTPKLSSYTRIVSPTSGLETFRHFPQNPSKGTVMNIKINLRKITEFGIGLTAVALLALAGCGGGGEGSASSGSTISTAGLVSTFARFYTPAYIASDGTNLYVTDEIYNNIRKIDIATGTVTTFAGSASGVSGASDAVGTSARFNVPKGITTDGINLYIADSYNHTIRQIAISTREVTTLAGTVGVSGVANATTGTSASFRYPWGISRIGTNLYVADSVNGTIRKIDISNASDAVSTLAGTPGGFGHTDLTGASAVFGYPAGLSTDGASFVYVTELLNNDVRKINASTGETTTVAGGNYYSPASGVGSTDGTGTSARFYSPYGITTDGTNLYVADTFNHTIRKIDLSGASAVVSTLAGTAGVSGVTDATGSAARFAYPFDVIYINGALYVADFANGSIRKIQL